MKKILSVLLALMMVMSLAMTVFAAEDELVMTTNPDDTKVNVVETSLEKLYNVIGAVKDSEVYPQETLSFSVEKDASNPDSTVAPEVTELEVSGQNGNKLEVTWPTFSKVGIYKFAITEDGEDTLGVSYDTTTTLYLTALVSYDYEDADEDGYGLEIETWGTYLAEGETEKVETITNTLTLGELTVQKLVDGNLASETDEFDITVTFSIPDGFVIRNSIYYNVAGGEFVEVKPEEISTPIVVTLSHMDSVHFVDLPSGIAYTVVEGDYTEGDANTVNGGYEAPVYELDGTQVDAVDDEIKAPENENEDAINDEVVITNVKQANIVTGVITESAPYIVLIAVCIAVAIMFILKRRNAYDF